MKTLSPVLALALTLCACAAPPAMTPASKGPHAMPMMEEMCRKHAEAPAPSASAPSMMAKHCKDRVEAPAAAASAHH